MYDDKRIDESILDKYYLFEDFKMNGYKFREATL